MTNSKTGNKIKQNLHPIPAFLAHPIFSKKLELITGCISTLMPFINHNNIRNKSPKNDVHVKPGTTVTITAIKQPSTLKIDAALQYLGHP